MVGVRLCSVRLAGALLCGVMPHAAPALAGQSYIGAERCRTCHEFEFRVWSSGPHAKARQALTPEQLGDAKCNTCHTMVAGSADERLAGVQCEQCHGSGQFYQYRYVMRDRELSRAVGLIETSASHCQRCHTEGAPSMEPFDYERAWARIDHGPKARERWLRTRGQSGNGDGKAP